jgi:hypothetical protein
MWYPHVSSILTSTVVFFWGESVLKAEWRSVHTHEIPKIIIFLSPIGSRRKFCFGALLRAMGCSLIWLTWLIRVSSKVCLRHVAPTHYEDQTLAAGEHLDLGFSQWRLVAWTFMYVQSEYIWSLQVCFITVSHFVSIFLSFAFLVSDNKSYTCWFQGCHKRTTLMSYVFYAFYAYYVLYEFYAWWIGILAPKILPSCPWSRASDVEYKFTCHRVPSKTNATAPPFQPPFLGYPISAYGPLHITFPSTCLDYTIYLCCLVLVGMQLGYWVALTQWSWMDYRQVFLALSFTMIMIS